MICDTRGLFNWRLAGPLSHCKSKLTYENVSVSSGATLKRKRKARSPAPAWELGDPVDCRLARTGLTVTRAATGKIWFTGNDFGCIRCNLGGQNGNRWNRSCLRTAVHD